MWWNVYNALYSKFPAKSGSERIFKIGLDLTKLLPKFRGFVFLEHGVYYICGAFLLRIRDGSISVFFCKIDTMSKKINLVSVYS